MIPLGDSQDSMRITYWFVEARSRALAETIKYRREKTLNGAENKMQSSTDELLESWLY